MNSGDLISRQAVIDIIHLFFTEEVDKIPTKKTEDGEVYIIRKCQPLFEMNKAICKRIRALPSASPTQNCVEKCVGNALDALDCISRQAVIDTEYQTIDINGIEYVMLSEVQMKARKLPPVNPQEPKYCDRNICVSNEYNGIGCDECEVTKSQEPKVGE